MPPRSSRDFPRSGSNDSWVFRWHGQDRWVPPSRAPGNPSRRGVVGLRNSWISWMINQGYPKLTAESYTHSHQACEIHERSDAQAMNIAILVYELRITQILRVVKQYNCQLQPNKTNAYLRQIRRSHGVCQWLLPIHSILIVQNQLWPLIINHQPAVINQYQSSLIIICHSQAYQPFSNVHNSCEGQWLPYKLGLRVSECVAVAPPTQRFLATVNVHPCPPHSLLNREHV